MLQLLRFVIEPDGAVLIVTGKKVKMYACVDK
jgi:hypothetical protein